MKKSEKTTLAAQDRSESLPAHGWFKENQISRKGRRDGTGRSSTSWFIQVSPYRMDRQTSLMLQQQGLFCILAVNISTRREPDTRKIEYSSMAHIVPA
jgi:hypothetical protein